MGSMSVIILLPQTQSIQETLSQREASILRYQSSSFNPKTSRNTNKIAKEGEPFTYFAKITLGILCFIWLLATIFCTLVGRWLRCANPRARRPFYYNRARAASDEEESLELDELDSGGGRRNGCARRVIDFNDLRMRIGVRVLWDRGLVRLLSMSLSSNLASNMRVSEAKRSAIETWKWREQN